MRGSPPGSLLRGRIRMIKTSRTISTAMQVLLCLLPLAGPAQAAESVYTDLDLDACETLAEDMMGVSLKCEGYKDYPVYFKEGDLRQSVIFGKIDQVLIDGAYESFAAFNRVNTKIEWRLMKAASQLRRSCDGSSKTRGPADRQARRVPVRSSSFPASATLASPPPVSSPWWTPRPTAMPTNSQDRQPKVTRPTSPAA